MLRRTRWTLAFGRTTQTLRAGDWRTAGFSHPFNPTSSVPPELNQAGNDLYAIGFYHSCTLGTRPWHLTALQKIKPSIKDQMQSNKSLSQMWQCDHVTFYNILMKSGTFLLTQYKIHPSYSYFLLNLSILCILAFCPLAWWRPSTRPSLPSTPATTRTPWWPRCSPRWKRMVQKTGDPQS